MKWSNTGKGREMTGKVAGEGPIEKSIIYCGVDKSCKQLQCLGNLLFSYDFWIVLGSNFQKRVVSSLD